MLIGALIAPWVGLVALAFVQYLQTVPVERLVTCASTTDNSPRSRIVSSSSALREKIARTNAVEMTSNTDAATARGLSHWVLPPESSRRSCSERDRWGKPSSSSPRHRHQCSAHSQCTDIADHCVCRYPRGRPERTVRNLCSRPDAMRAVLRGPFAFSPLEVRHGPHHRNDQGVVVEHGSLKARIGTHVGAHLFAQPAGIDIGGRLKKHPEHCPATGLQLQQVWDQLPNGCEVTDEGQAGQCRPTEPHAVFGNPFAQFVECPKGFVIAFACGADLRWLPIHAKSLSRRFVGR